MDSNLACVRTLFLFDCSKCCISPGVTSTQNEFDLTKFILWWRWWYYRISLPDIGILRRAILKQYTSKFTKVCLLKVEMWLVESVNRNKWLWIFSIQVHCWIFPWIRTISIVGSTMVPSLIQMKTFQSILVSQFFFFIDTFVSFIVSLSEANLLWHWKIVWKWRLQRGKFDPQRSVTK